ncbi:hypothetical protein E1265_02125 [Streptomyces sp. 8K308]|uniref:hypothetical protein n=1 Tax=Streptomyces sp. 8K308 TaxID=2530388 RepID=UPI00104740DC|nr:hypothetical protein [Streptomyces sp. 8K308]TDC27309.1 hypothetical protein E1265_02125 [Streptomyces sp. 8K308]
MGTTVHDFHAEEPELRRAMEQAVGGLAPPVDLVPAALALGRRRRAARVRLATAGGGVAAATLATVLVIGFVPRDDDARAQPPTSTVAEPGPVGPTLATPVPTEDAEDYHERAVDYRARVVAMLSEQLPEELGAVSTTDYDIAGYRASAENGVDSLVTFSATRADIDPDAGRCDENAAPGRCTEVRLSDGTPLAVNENSAGGTVFDLWARFAFGGVVATIGVAADAGTGSAVPVDSADLAALAESQEARELLLEGAELAQAMAS